MHLMAPRDTKYFHPDEIAMIKQGDENEHSKKDPQLRRVEQIAYHTDTLTSFGLKLLTHHTVETVYRLDICPIGYLLFTIYPDLPYCRSGTHLSQRIPTLFPYLPYNLLPYERFLLYYYLQGWGVTQLQ